MRYRRQEVTELLPPGEGVNFLKFTKKKQPQNAVVPLPNGVFITFLL